MPQEQQTESELRRTLNQLAADNRLRRLKTMDEPRRPQVVLAGQSVLDFCHNDYLGLSHHPKLKAAAQEAVDRYGAGTGGARLIGGTWEIHTRLEAHVAAFKQTPAALVFNSGYQANVGILSGLAGRHDVILADKLNHASLVDGAILSRAKHIRYPHLDTEALEKHLKALPRTVRRFIVTDTVFSMDGDCAPLADLFDLADRYDAWLVLDEAHATGVFGLQHRSGLWETTGLGHHDRVIQVGTFSKALGSFGAYVAASHDVIDSLVQFSRSFVYSTSLPPAVIMANQAALDVLSTEPCHTERLWESIRTFQDAMADSGVPVRMYSAIAPVVLGDAGTTVDMAQTLLDAGFYVQAIRPPTVPEGTARLRITLSASHEAAQIKALVGALSRQLAV